MKKAVRFEFGACDLNIITGVLRLQYAVHFDDLTQEEFVETITFPSQNIILRSADEIKPLIQAVHLVCGISYYKLYCPRQIVLREYAISRDQAEFFNILYTKGLGEFYYRNNIDYRGLVRFPYDDRNPTLNKPPIIRVHEEEKALLPFGGGKDSIVAADMLHKKGVRFAAFTLNPQQLHTSIIQKMGVEQVSVYRVLDKQIFTLNTSGNVYNGHIPITAVYSFVAILTAALYGYAKVVMSNEKSANYGNVTYLGEVINHQWSKGEEFEKSLRKYLLNIGINIDYFSILRNTYEIAVARRFARLPMYHKLFSSCNSNFTINNNQKKGSVPLWCGTCPKCAFVYALIAGFMKRDEVLGIFGSDLFNDKKLIPIYRQLLGIEGVKPFECVGTPEEMMVACKRAYDRGEYRESAVMQMFEQELLYKKPDINRLESILLPDET